MYLVILEVFLVIFFAYYFYTKEKPKLRFLFLGIIFSIVSLFLQLPLRIFEVELKSLMSSTTLPLLLIAFGVPIISELTKYFSLKRYLKTKSQKNGIFFGIGWVGVESISYISLILYSTVFSYISLTYQPQNLVESTLPLWSFLFFLIINISVTVLVVLAVIKRKKYFLFYAIIYSALIYLTLIKAPQPLLFQIIFVVYSFFIIFKYRSFR